MLQKGSFIFLFLLLLYVTRFFDYVNWDPTIGGRSSYFLSLFLGIIFLLSVEKIWKKYTLFSSFLVFLIPLQLFSLLTLVDSGYSLRESRVYIYEVSIFLFYFVCVAYKFTPKTIISALLVCGIITLVIQVYQQLNIDKASFGVFSPTSVQYQWHGKAAMRHGLYRFRLDHVYYISYLCYFYFWDKFLHKLDLRYLIFAALFLISIYLYLTRQILFVTLLASLISFMFVRGARDKGLSFILIFCMFIYLLYNGADIFNEVFMRERGEFVGQETRAMEYAFYWTEITKTPMSLLFGNAYNPLHTYFETELRMFSSDVGIVGQIYLYGVISTVYFYAFMVYILNKTRRTTPLYLKLFFFTILVDAVMISPFERVSHRFIFILALYLCSYFYYKNDRLYKLKIKGE